MSYSVIDSEGNAKDIASSQGIAELLSADSPSLQIFLETGEADEELAKSIVNSVTDDYLKKCFSGTPPFILSNGVEEDIAIKGGAGSGNFNHSGRPGQRGGSGEGSGEKLTEAAQAVEVASEYNEPIQENESLRDHLEGMARMKEQFAPKDWKYKSNEEFLLKNGEFFKAAPKPKDVEQGKLGLCYMNAMHLVQSDPDKYTYVEGIATSNGIPIDHAWVVTNDGTVVDNTWSHPRLKELKEPTYFGVRIPEETVMKTAMSRGKYGVLFNPEEHFPILRDGLPKGGKRK